MKQFILKEAPDAKLSVSNFELQEVELPKPEDGQVLVRNILLSIDAANRTWMQGRTYRDQVVAGDVMPSYSVAEIIESKDPEFGKGQIVTADSFWAEYSIIQSRNLNKCPENISLPNLLSLFGIAGLTAYHGLFDVGEVKDSDTVVVSAAAGSVGVYVGQLAKAIGCKVIGVAGGEAKCKKVVEELGFDGCIDYKNANLVRDLKIYCPEGIDLYFDNVGGAVLEAVLIRMKNKGRVVCCGAVSQYESSSPIGPRNIPGFVITKRLKLEGFIVMDFKEKHLEAITHMKKLLNEGKITIVEDITEGLQNAPKALVNLLSGKNFGKSMVRVGPDPDTQKMS
ncbi:NADP-dependent oxidoreductase [Paracoccaceae bacterium]|nr:NADP-dependent oxidoreductase [Paracoccaceae bacterium]